MKQALSLTTRSGKLALTVLTLATLALGALPTSAQAPAENVVGVYRFNSNLHTGIYLYITGQVPVQPHPNTGEPRARFEGYVANGSVQEPVAGFVTGTWSAQRHQPVKISFSRHLGPNSIQAYQGAFGRNTSGRAFMAGTFSHPGAGSPYPWMADR
jgi:hypothetical protein